MPGGCAGPLSALDPAGPGAASVAGIWWVMFWGSMAIVVLVLALAFYSTFRDPERRIRAPARLLILGGGVLFPLAVITGLLVYGLRSEVSLAGTSEDDVFRVEVVGHQWWWEVRYPDVDGARLHLANQIHVPAGRPFEIQVTTADVIHSFWVPRLGGKIDAIPGLTNVIRLEAPVPGLYRGQCSEYCGVQHARMGLVVVAQEEAELQETLSWLAARTGRQEDPPSPGAEAFSEHCADCHSLDAGDPQPRIGPNLAGLPERGYLGAGSVANTPENLRMWIRRHQQIKPGNHMPVFTHLEDETIEAIARFLEQAR